MNPITIGLIFLVVLLVYLLYTFSRAASLMQGITTLRTQTVIQAEKIASPNANTVYYDCWVFITSDNVSDTSDKIIFGREFNLVLNGKTLKLLKGNMDTNGKYQPVGAASISSDITSNFPMNKWVFISVNINGNVAEVFLNGKLAATVPMANALSPSKLTALRVGGGLYGTSLPINGYITKLRRLTKPMTSDFVWSKYLEGNGQFSGIFGSFFDYFDSYSAKLIMKQSSSKEQEIKLF